MAETPDPYSTVPVTDARGTSGWVGWVAFAGVIMFMLGIFHVVEGIVALAKNEYFLVGRNGLVVNIDYTAWGWTHIIAGIIVMLAGVGVLAGQVWARVVGVVVAMLSMVLSVLFMAAYPVLAILMIALAVVVIMALTVHGSEIKAGD